MPHGTVAPLRSEVVGCGDSQLTAQVYCEACLIGTLSAFGFKQLVGIGSEWTAVDVILKLVS